MSALPKTSRAELDEVGHVMQVFDGKKVAIAGPELTPAQIERAAYVVVSTCPCLLCDGKPYAVNWWKIPDQLAKGGPGRVYFALCWICKQTLPETVWRKRVEEQLINMLLQTRGTVH